MYDSRADLVARLTEIRSAIAKARVAQSYDMGGTTNVQRGNLRALLEEERSILNRIEAIDRRSDGMANKAKFERPS